MNTSELTEQFISGYLNQLKYEDFALVLNRTGHAQDYITASSHKYFAKYAPVIYDVISKLSEDERNEYIDDIMHTYTKQATFVFEKYFLDEEFLSKCIDKKPHILRNILGKPTDIQKIIIDDWRKYNSTDENKDEFVIVNEKNDQTLYKIIDKKVENKIKHEEELWNKTSIEELGTIFKEIMIKYDHHEKNTMTAHLICAKIELGINLTALQHYCLRRHEKEEQFKKEDIKNKLKKEELWGTMSLNELDDMQNNTINAWNLNGGQPSSDKETDLKLFHMRQYIGQKRIDERYA